MRTHGGDINIFNDELCQRPGLTGRVNIDGRNAPLRIEAAAQGTAAVNNRHADFFGRRLAFAEAVHRFPTGQRHQAVHDIRARARGHIKNLLAIFYRQRQRAAPAAITFNNTNSLAHDAPL